MLAGNRIYKCENMQFTVKAQLNYLVILAAGLGYIQTEETLFTLEVSCCSSSMHFIFSQVVAILYVLIFIT